MSRTIEVADEEIEKNYNEFWKEIIEDGKGNINKKQLMKELHTYSFILNEVPKVYCEITNGSLSYPNYKAESVIDVYQDILTKDYLYKKYIQEEAKDILNDNNMSDKEKLAEIKNYLEIEDD